MDRAESGGLFTMSGHVTGQHDRAGIRVAGPQIIKKFRPEIWDGLRVEDEEIRLRVDNDAVGLGKRRRDIHLGGWCRFLKGRVNFFGQLQIRLEDEDAPARRGFINGMVRRRFVHEFKKGGGACASSPRATPYGQMPAPREMESSFSVEGRALSRP